MAEGAAADRERAANGVAVKVSVVRAKDLPASELAHWAAIQSGDRRLDSPYFRPEFTAAVAAVRPAAEVGILDAGRGVIAFFPFERRAFGIATPIGGRMSDFHGLIGGAEHVDLPDLLRGCRLNAWDFDHLLASQAVFAPFAGVHSRSPCVDVAGGFDAYVAGRRQAGSQNVQQLRRKERRLVAAVGPIRFEAESIDPGVFRQTLAWKSAQYRATALPDIFTAQPWTLGLLAHIRSQRQPAFAGMVSALFAGDRLVAGHVGMRSETVWHYWFPAHDPAYAAFSPGALLLLKMIEHAPAIGITRLDLGKGEARYKSRFMNGAVPLIEGRLERDSAVTACRRAARRVYHWARLTPPARALRQFRHGHS
jgi:CelD/BcsL family acetyltransferase involved in cellulose biosynthesis